MKLDASLGKDAPEHDTEPSGDQLVDGAVVVTGEPAQTGAEVASNAKDDEPQCGY